MSEFKVSDLVVKNKYGDGTIYTIEKLMNGNWNMMLLRSTNPEHENSVVARQCQFRIAIPEEIKAGRRLP